MFLDASGMKLGAHTSQIEAENVDEVLKHDNCPALLCSWKLNNHKINCAATDKEPLSIADALAEHRSILLGVKTCAYSDHKNVAHLNATCASNGSRCHRPLLEDFGCTTFHVPEEKNELVDVFLRFHVTSLD